MLEAMDYLRGNGFKTYIVSGFGQDFMRAYSERIYGIPTEQVVGSSLAMQYEFNNGKPDLMRLPKLFFDCNFDGKVDWNRPVHWQASLCRLRQFHRGSADAGMDWRGKRRA